MLAVALDKQEWDDYKWWVQAGQDPDKFAWSSPDKAGTEDPMDFVESVTRFTKAIGKSQHTSPEQVAEALGRPFLLYDGLKYYDKDMNPVVMTDDLMNKAIIKWIPNEQH